ncbi:uncharacterized protein K460DRAFT_358609 [Cucurbitaria berberidis CBS 394.84]|uniref:Uncharacterized protein n=1 Tax=Cucurbitaria berberidis CBS 394.84 TaxID=1168544 RepID=A0A9P4GAK9_9PLEO|nr:uncharacterized protein K460DRAFT_358609 [Cucurbitaria berberidis CBS 394.84]KAF1841917.1 hypothetical protein K460DRAFT_358609 [Cucurbitaria berberidis CBS 394.84]
MTSLMQFEPTAMDIDRDESPSVKSDTSHVSFTNDCESLPASGPVSHAHIINIGEYTSCIKEEGAIKLQDAVVTTLFNVSPDTLMSFLSPTVNTFKAIFGKGDTQLVVWRKGLEVFIGTFEHHKSMKKYRFEQVAGFLIGYDGSWQFKVTASNAYSNSKWADVWAGRFECFGGVARMAVEFEELDMAKRSSMLAESILNNRYWELKADIKAA